MRVVVCTLAFITAFAAARYFLDPPPFLRVPTPAWFPEGAITEAASNVAPHLYQNHRALFLTHVGCGIMAIILGLFQFGKRRRSHRRVGIVYCVAVLVACVSAVPLSFFITGAAPEAIRPRFLPVTLGFLALAAAWFSVTAMAFVRARQRRFDDHGAWMIRSYSLTFAAATIRLVAPVILVATNDIALTVPLAIWSWPLNLAVAEWLIRRGRTMPALAQAGSS